MYPTLNKDSCILYLVSGVSWENDVTKGIPKTKMRRDNAGPRSQSSSTRLVFPKTRTMAYEERCFASAAPKLCNKLP